MNPWNSEVGMIRWVTSYNATGVDIPPYAALELTQYSIGDAETDGTFYVTAPTNDSQTVAIAFNGPATLPAGAWGQVTSDLPNWGAVDPGNDGSGSGIGSGAGSGHGIPYPVAGEEWGTLAGSFYLQPDKFGFRVLGFDPDASASFAAPRVMVVVGEGGTAEFGSGSGSGSGVTGPTYTYACRDGTVYVTRVS